MIIVYKRVPCIIAKVCLTNKHSPLHVRGHFVIFYPILQPFYMIFWRWQVNYTNCKIYYTIGNEGCWLECWTNCLDFEVALKFCRKVLHVLSAKMPCLTLSKRIHKFLKSRHKHAFHKIHLDLTPKISCLNLKAILLHSLEKDFLRLRLIRASQLSLCLKVPCLSFPSDFFSGDRIEIMH